MIFYSSGDGNEYIRDGDNLIPFISGKLVTEDEKLIQKLIDNCYQYDEEERELTYSELKEKAKNMGIEGYQKMKKAELKELIGG